MTNALQYNILDENSHLLCPACGFANYARVPAYDDSRGIIGTTICPCCLWEPGFDDDPSAFKGAKPTIIESIIAYRANWKAQMRWCGKAERRPKSWDAKVQIEKLYAIAPNVRS